MRTFQQEYLKDKVRAMGYERFTVEADTLRLTIPGAPTAGTFIASFNSPNEFLSIIYDFAGDYPILVDFAAPNINLRVISDAGHEHFVDNLQRIDFSSLLHYGLIRLYFNSIVSLTTTTLLVPVFRVKPTCCTPKKNCNACN